MSIITDPAGADDGPNGSRNSFTEADQAGLERWAGSPTIEGALARAVLALTEHIERIEAALAAAQEVELRTRRLVVVDELGRERIVAETYDNGPEVIGAHLVVTTDAADRVAPSDVTLQVDGDCLGVYLMERGNGVGQLHVLHDGRSAYGGLGLQAWDGTRRAYVDPAEGLELVDAAVPA